MTARRHRRPALVALASLATLASLAAIPAGSATAADEATDAPVAVADAITIRATESGNYLDVLANDGDPNGDDLAICRIEVPDDAPIYVERTSRDFYEGDPILVAGRREGSAEQLRIQATDNRAATVEFTYYACDRDYLTPATVTVTIRATPQVRARKVPGKPGRIRFTNPGNRRVVVLYGSPREDNLDGKLGLAPHRGHTVRVTRHRIVFLAFVRRTGELVGFGRVRNIRLPGGRGAIHHSYAKDISARDLRLWRSKTR